MQQAADNGVPGAQERLAHAYFAGKFGVEKDIVKSYVWIVIAATNGDEHSKQGKEFLKKRLTPEQLAKAEAKVKEMTEKNPRLLK
jgi:TPR repeat protein